MNRLFIIICLIFTVFSKANLEFENMNNVEFQENEVEIYSNGKQFILSIKSYSYLNEDLTPKGQFDMNNRVYYSRRIEIPVKLEVKVLKTDQTYALIHSNNKIKMAEFKNFKSLPANYLFSEFDGIRSDYSLLIGLTKIKAINQFGIILKSDEVGSIYELTQDDGINIGHSTDDISIKIMPLTNQFKTYYYLDKKFGPTFIYRKYSETKSTLQQLKLINL